jgi:hypothetical protein|uniref:Uncharacterized protein n=1 Tax=uncultured marine virus TaxID=186617 RepID=A0A0F7L0H1_9VIRU|nr:hypothetical protein [uncultured marine virus]
MGNPVLTNTMKFFDMNYLEFSSNSITGSNLNTQTALDYAYDNRSDTGLVGWTAANGTVVFDFSGTTYHVDSIMLANHNFLNLNVLIHTGSGLYLTVSGSSNATQTTDTFYLNFPPSYVGGFKLEFSTTVDSLSATCGEIILTKQKFELHTNPDKYKPKLNPTGVSKQLWDGSVVYNQSGDRKNAFSADLGYSFLENMEGNTMVWGTTTGDPIGGVWGTISGAPIGDAWEEYGGKFFGDLENLSELARTRVSFLFWPNSNNKDLGMYSWNKRDIFKCKILNQVTYEFPAPNMTNFIIADYELTEVR